MHIIKLPWFGHNTAHARVGCYSVTISPDGTRLASGGLDGNVKIWNPQLVLQFVPEEEKTHVKLKEEKKDLKSNEMKEGKDGNVKDDKEDEGNETKEAKEAKEAKEGQKGPKHEAVKEKNIEEIKKDRVDFFNLKVKFEKRALCTMNRHNGAVTCVKFSPNGRFLASGSDDKIVLIWEKDGDGPRPKQFGDTEGDLEHWTVRKRLVAHENDVQDIAWLPDGTLLVTVGLDRLIIVWSGTTFERVKRYDIHQLMVKGVVFDPANKFFATASDDRSVRIFRYSRSHPLLSDYEFQMEQLVVDPFKKSPLTSYFRRMSWSPDGQHIAVPNATNGPVTSVAIINRGSWGSDISLIGHEAPCEVCLFSPRLYQTEQNSKSDFVTVVATGGQDLSLAIWSTAVSQPLVVAENAVEDAITDICWTPDGQTLFASSLDGSITCVAFDKDELGYLAPMETNDVQLNRYGTDRESTIFAESVEQLQLEEMEEKLLGLKPLLAREPEKLLRAKMEPVEIETPLTSTSIVSSSSTSTAASTSIVSASLKQRVVTMKNGKKRVAPLLVSAVKPAILPLQSSATKLAASSTSSRQKLSSKLSQMTYNFPRTGISTGVHGLKSRGDAHSNFVDNSQLANEEDNDNDDMLMLEEQGDGNGSKTQITGIALKKQRARWKRAIMEQRYPSYFRLVSSLPEVLFHHSGVLNKRITEIAKTEGNNDNIFATTYDTADEELLFSLLSALLKLKDETINVEVRNGLSWSVPENDESQNYNGPYYDGVDFQDPTQVIVSSTAEEKRRNYVLYFPYKIQFIVPVIDTRDRSPSGSKRAIIVIASFSGTIQFVEAKSGNFILPSIELGCNIVVLRQSGSHILCTTSSGLIYVWKVNDSSKYGGVKPVLKAVSLATIWNNQLLYKSSDFEKNPVDSCEKGLRAIEIDPEDGTPYVQFILSEEIYHFSNDLQCWTRVNDPWHFLAFEESEELNFGHSNNVKSMLLKKSWLRTREEIDRCSKRRYIGEFDELKKSMRRRFEEMTEIES